jgi:hypothetical protein
MEIFPEAAGQSVLELARRRKAFTALLDWMSAVM